MTTTTNEPISKGNTGLLGFERKADTFLLRTFWDQYAVSLEAALLSPARTFADERETFRSALPMLFARHAGEWVAISGGQVVEHDLDRKAVTRRFFQNRTRGPVYIGFVGSSPTIRQATPFRARRRA